jgi:chemotaxis family two-component system sensor kinase Cph1
MTPVAAPNLANCADEPIHIPGSIQPHGVLLAFDRDSKLLAWSANAAAVLAIDPVLGAAAAALGLPPEALAVLAAASAELDNGEALPNAGEVRIGEQQFDCIVHGYQSRLLLEFERRAVRSDVVASFALKAHGAIDRLKRQGSIDALLNMAVRQVRQLTGFDRVMAYHFRHDDSGDVVAEARDEAIDAYLGRRYPATDSPAQARRLYLINTLRLIADVGYQSVPVLGRAGDAPVDMSHSVLRSVSPIHVEYLQNMGVQASMSVSIVVNGRLWGMLACHHMTPRQVPYSIRMATDVLAQVLASSVQTLEAKAEAARIERAAELSSRMLAAMAQQDNVVATLDAYAEPLRQTLGADALIVSQLGELTVHGDLDVALATAIVHALPARDEVLLQYTGRDDWPAPLRGQLGTWVGMLAMSFDAGTQGVMVALRHEQVEQVRWAGKPDKVIAHGPLGPRLTPRGSFNEWRETVRGRAEPWDATALTIAGQLLAKLSRSVAARNAEIDRARTELMAMLGHDLRDPLHTINMAGVLLERGAQSATLGRRIQSSSNRMQRLIGHVLDLSRINGGIGLGIHPVPVALDQVVAELVEDVRAAHPGASFALDMPAPVSALVDADRFVQVLANLLSNARHHGELGKPIRVGLHAADGHAVLTVRNHGAPISAAIADKLFDPFKHTSLYGSRNRRGVGLGLYIARQIVLGHSGRLTYHYEAPQVVFTAHLPLHTPISPTIL